MSLQHVLRAQKLGCCFEDEESLARLDDHPLGEVRDVDTGCDMLMVYLLNRLGRIYESGTTDELEYSEEFHMRVVRAYLEAGCDPDEELPARAINAHTPLSFRMAFDEVIEKRFAHEPMTSTSFVEMVLDDYHPDMNPAIHSQLERLASLLGAEA